MKKLGYLCKYTPLEIFSALNVEMTRLDPVVSSFPTADALLHPNVCSYVKSVLETASSGFANDPELCGIVLTTCCDSVKRLYDALTREFPDKFFYLLDVPRKGNDFAAELYAERIRGLVHAFGEFCGEQLPEERWLSGRGDADDTETPATSFDTAGASTERPLQIGILGARSDPQLTALLSEGGAEILFDLTCTGLMRDVPVTSNSLTDYAFRLLNQLPCMRMQKATDRTDFLSGFLDRLDGIVYHTIKFCDNFSFEYADLKAHSPVPLLIVETDGTSGAYGQLKTRAEAFLEELKAARGVKSGAPVQRVREGNAMYVVGIDSGSTSTNAVVLNEKKEIVAYEVLRTGAKSNESAERILEAVLQKAGITRDDVRSIVSTGYGRVSIPFADENVTEISCHGRGAHFLNPNVRTILDIGGQDSKAIRLNERGDVVDFVMNDKCAAGTGRFLEAMARTLELPIEELGPVSLQAKEDVEISSMCTVFAESEVISLIALNKETADIAAGVHRAIARKASGLLRKVGVTPEIMMTGGVAKNPGVVAELESLLRVKLFLPEEPEIVGALGAALFAGARG